MRDLSNYPPGHPRGIEVRGNTQPIFTCNPCNRWIEPWESLKLRLQIKHGFAPTCPYCKELIPRAACECGRLATHLETDRPVNYTEAFCNAHGMGRMRVA